MAKARKILKRVKAVKSIRTVTKTMEMVATARFRKTHQRVAATRPYVTRLAQTVSELISRGMVDGAEHPLLKTPSSPKRDVLLVLTSNRGLAGGFNSNLIKEARRRIDVLTAEGYHVDLIGVGKKGIGFFRYIGRKFRSERTDIGDRPTPDHAASVVDDLTKDFAEGRIGVVDLVQSKFISVLNSPPTTVRVLPIAAPVKARGGMRPDYILSPDAATLLEALLPLYVRNTMYRGLVETVAAEQAARRTAMKNATDNAGDLLEALKRTYNRQRQAQITQEIAELVGGAAALQG